MGGGWGGGVVLVGPGHYQKISEENSDLTVTVVQPANLGLDGLIELTNNAVAPIGNEYHA